MTTLLRARERIIEVSEIPEIGKISPEIFNELIFPRLGAKSEKVLVGPQHGVDVGIVEIGDLVPKSYLAILSRFQ